MKLISEKLSNKDKDKLIDTIYKIFNIYKRYYHKDLSIKELSDKLDIDEFELIYFLDSLQDIFIIQSKKINNQYIPYIIDINYNNENSSKDDKTLYIKPIYDSNNWLKGYILDKFGNKNSKNKIIKILNLLNIDYNKYGFEIDGIWFDGFFIPTNGVNSLQIIFKYKIKEI